jgi:membrane associated rhomboid family serine protease
MPPPRPNGSSDYQGPVRDKKFILASAGIDIGFSVFVVILGSVLGIAFDAALLGCIAGIIGGVFVYALITELQRRLYRRKEWTDD